MLHRDCGKSTAAEGAGGAISVSVGLSYPPASVDGARGETMVDCAAAAAWQVAEPKGTAPHVLARLERAHIARNFRPVDATHAAIVGALHAEAAVDLGSYVSRRRAEDDISAHVEPWYPELAEKMRHCRREGCTGYRENREGEPKLMVGWDRKCTLTRLCPDETREEQQRIAQRYEKHIDDWRRRPRDLDHLSGRHYAHQVIYCVLSWPNVAPGELATAKRTMFRECRDWLKSCKAIKGWLASQEDPLSARGDWNLHTNLVLLVHGQFEWGEARRAWYQQTRHHFPTYPDFQVHFQDITRRREYGGTLRELLKYLVKHVAAPHDKKAGRERQRNTTAPGVADAVRPATSLQFSPGPNRHARRAGIVTVHGGEPGKYSLDHKPIAPTKSEAPPLTAWSEHQFREWWEAGKRFRRVRSGGVLYRIGKEDRPLGKVTWTGRIRWDDRLQVYVVTPITPTTDLAEARRAPSISSIPADKSEPATPARGGRAPP